MGFFNFLRKTAMYGGLIFVGYAMHGCVSNDSRYSIKRYDKKPFLVDKRMGERIEIFNRNGKMQLGDLEYRLECIIEDNQLKDCIDSLKNKRGIK